MTDWCAARLVIFNYFISSFKSTLSFSPRCGEIHVDMCKWACLNQKLGHASTWVEIECYISSYCPKSPQIDRVASCDKSMDGYMMMPYHLESLFTITHIIRLLFFSASSFFFFSIFNIFSCKQVWSWALSLLYESKLVSFFHVSPLHRKNVIVSGL